MRTEAEGKEESRLGGGNEVVLLCAARSTRWTSCSSNNSRISMLWHKVRGQSSRLAVAQRTGFPRFDSLREETTRPQVPNSHAGPQNSGRWSWEEWGFLESKHLSKDPASKQK